MAIQEGSKLVNKGYRHSPGWRRQAAAGGEAAKVGAHVPQPAHISVR
jgi:hypothetical protein